MLNQNLAEFYGINGVKGNKFRPVKLSERHKRGGLLSQGSFLSGHSDGVQAHTIKRTVWLKEKILSEHRHHHHQMFPKLIQIHLVLRIYL